MDVIKNHQILIIQKKKGYFIENLIKKNWMKKVNKIIALTEFAKQKYIEAGLPETQIVINWMGKTELCPSLLMRFIIEAVCDNN